MPRPRPALDLRNPQHAFAMRLQQLHRRAHKPPQKTLAGVLLCSPSRVSDFLTGRAFPDWIYVERFVQHCGGDLDEFHNLWESADEQIEILQRFTAPSARPIASGAQSPHISPRQAGSVKFDLDTPDAVVSAETSPARSSALATSIPTHRRRLPDPFRSRVVLVGASSFHSPELEPIPHVAANIEGMAQLFLDPQICGITTSNVSAVCDPLSLMDVGAPILDAAQGAEELLLLYYSGHGLIGTDGELHLAMSSTQVGHERMHWSAVPFRLIRETMRSSPAKNQALLLDCCFSGRAIEAMSDRNNVIHGQTDIEGAFTLASSDRNMPALAPRGARYTSFTGELIQLFASGVAGGPEYLSLGEISRQLVRTMRTKALPSPLTHGTNTAHELDLIRNRAWSPESKGSPLS